MIPYDMTWYDIITLLDLILWFDSIVFRMVWPGLKYNCIILIRFNLILPDSTCLTKLYHSYHIISYHITISYHTISYHITFSITILFYLFCFIDLNSLDLTWYSMVWLDLTWLENFFPKFTSFQLYLLDQDIPCRYGFAFSCLKPSDLTW